jgi:hypothetical protein
MPSPFTGFSVISAIFIIIIIISILFLIVCGSFAYLFIIFGKPLLISAIKNEPLDINQMIPPGYILIFVIVIIVFGAICQIGNWYMELTPNHLDTTSGKSNIFLVGDNYNDGTVYVSTEEGIALSDQFSTYCLKTNKYQERRSYLKSENASIGWKFITFGVSITNNLKNNSSIIFNPGELIDTDKLSYSKDQIYNYNFCGDDAFASSNYDLERKIEPNNYAPTFTMLYKIPMTSIPDKFRYYIHATNTNEYFGRSGELILR